MKKLLIITYYWPPGGGVTVIRCLKMAKYLRQHGWEPVILTAEGAHYPVLDPTGEKDVPEGIEVLRVPIWEPYAIYKKFMGKPADENVNNVFYIEQSKADWKHRLAVWVRSNFFIPDARASWIRPSIKFLKDYLKDHPVDAILSSGPPHTNTRIGTLISKATGIPLICDYQDPWTQVDYYQLLSLTPWGRRRHERMEQEAFRQATLSLIVSPSWKEDLEEIGADNVKVLPLGYDPDDFDRLVRRPHEKFTLTHLGLLGYDRCPDVLFAALAELVKEDAAFAADFELRLYGQVDYRVKETMERYELTPWINYAGYVSRGEAIQETLNSHLLLLALNQQDNVKGRVPGKLFEYMAARRPVLCFGPADSDTVGMLRASESGVNLPYTAHRDDVMAALRSWHADYRAGRETNLPMDAVLPYTHPTLTGQLAEWLNTVVATNKPTS